jgi:hypothetical protein
VRLLLSTVLLGLAWFAAVNVVVSAGAWLAARHVVKPGRTAPGAVLLVLRLLPACTAILFVALVFVPAHLRFEPAESDERFGLILSSLAVLGVWMLARSAWRLLQVSAAARRARLWMLLVPVESAAGDTYEVSGFAGVSLAGVLRTRILIGSSARVTLTPEELDLAIAHEHAHRRSLDNLKRCAMFCAPDVFGGSAVAARIEERWRAEAEREADVRAVAGDERRAVHLASALVKVARLGTQSGGGLSSPLWSTFNEPPLLEIRVRSLVSACSRPQPRRRLLQCVAMTLAASTAAFIWFADTSHDVHLLTEAFVAVLP